MLSDATLSCFWIVLVKISHLLPVSVASNLQIECLADLYRASGNNWKGYSLKNLSLTRLGMIDLTIAFPSDWKLQACCQKIQLRFSSENLQNMEQGHANEENYFLPIAEWTLCSPDLRLFNCYGFITDKMPTALLREVSLKRSSWWIMLQTCFVPNNKSVGYEMSTFSEHLVGQEEVQAGRYSGSNTIETFTTLNGPNLPSSKQILSPCVIEGSFDTEEQWFSNIISLSVPKESSISYRFLFHQAEPSNAALFDVLFYSDEDVDRLPKADKCDSNSVMFDSHWSQKEEESHKILPLSIGNVWSGCSVENFNGTPTYTCEGGRNFPAAHTVHIAISNCKKPSGFKLFYFIEISNFDSECPVVPDSGYGDGLASSSNCTKHFSCRFLFIVLLIHLQNSVQL